MILSTNRPSGTLGSAVRNDVIVAFMDGRELRGTILSFNPQLPTFLLHCKQRHQEAMSREIGFEGVKMVSFLRDPAKRKSKVVFPSTARLVTVRFLDRNTMRGVAQTYGGARVGIFLVPTALPDIERIYVPISAIRDVVSVKRLGEILTEEKMVTPDMVERAIQKQQELRGQKLGQILIKKRIITDDKLAEGLSQQKHEPVSRRIGDILLQQGFIDRVQLEEALEAQARQREKKLGEIMVEMGYATFKMIGIALAIQYNVPFIDLTSQSIDPRLRAFVPGDTARRWHIMPLSLQAKVLTIVVADPSECAAQDELRERTGLTVITVVATPQDIARNISRFYGP